MNIWKLIGLAAGIGFVAAGYLLMIKDLLR